MKVMSIPKNVRGFDCNAPLSFDQARMFVRAGYRFILRYVPRLHYAPHDLTSHEVDALLSAGLAIMPVQHVEPDDWVPSLDKGYAYGKIAAESAKECGIPSGTSLWLDLEGVRLRTNPEDVIRYCNTWYDQVIGHGFLPGIYVGWRAILTSGQLYRRLKFTRYWSAYNLNADQYPAVVGVCMQQRRAHVNDYPPRFDGFPVDVDIVTGDAKGRFPFALAPDEWDITSPEST